MGAPFIGEIRLFGGSFAIRGWARCDGQLLNISEYPNLFSVIGPTYGGDGLNTFALPNLQGRIPIHSGSGPGLTPRQVGQAGGSSTVTLTTSQMPSHQHTLQAGSASGGTSNDPLNNRITSPAKGGNLFAAPAPGAAGADVVSLDPQAISSTGGGAPHNNMQPYLAVTFLIALEGDFPSPR